MKFPGNVIVSILREVVHGLKSDVHEFIDELISKERRLTKEEGSKYKQQSGIIVEDFIILLKKFGQNLQQEDLNILISSWQIHGSEKFLDLSMIYDMIDNLIHELKIKKSQGSAKDLAFQLWEQSIYRKLATYLRKINLNIETTFRKIDFDSSGFISFEEYQKFLLTAGLGLSLLES